MKKLDIKPHESPANLAEMIEDRLFHSTIDSYHELSERSGVNPFTVNSLRTGHIPTPRILVKICRALAFSKDDYSLVNQFLEEAGKAPLKFSEKPAPQITHVSKSAKIRDYAAITPIHEIMEVLFPPPEVPRCLRKHEYRVGCRKGFSPDVLENILNEAKVTDAFQLETIKESNHYALASSKQRG